MKEFEDQQDGKFEQVEIGEQELLIGSTSTFVICTGINPSPSLFAIYNLLFFLSLFGCVCLFGEQRWLSQFVPGSIPAWCHMWVEFVVGSRLAPRVFPGCSGFLSTRANFTNSSSTRIEDPLENQLWLMWLPL